MTYNPFIKGNYPVGVRTLELAGKNDTYTIEIWYPAADEYRGVEAIDTFKFVDELPATTQEAVRDADPSANKLPLVMYWHGGYGHRREMAAMCIQLASRGFVVAAPDFPGDNVKDTFGSDPTIAKKSIDESAKARPVQAAEIIELLSTCEDELLAKIIDESAGVGSFGMSMGGFTTLAVNSESERMKASLAICPMTGTRSTVPGVVRLGGLLRTDDWKSAPSTFVLSGSEDCFVIADDVRDLFVQISEPKTLAILNGAGHIHWVDNAEFIHETMRARYASGEFPDPEINSQQLAKLMRPFAELCPAEHAANSMRAIAVAQFEANLKSNGDARAFLEDDLAATFAERGYDFEITGKRNAYNPFKSGEYPVGVRTIETTEEPRSGRKITVEVWYPASEEYKGKEALDRFTIAPGLPELSQDAVRDAEGASLGRLPLVMYFHGGYGFRREMAHVATNLASHGYIVAAPDFPGDSISDLQLTEKKDGAQTFAPDESALMRPHQASFVISSLISKSPFSSLIDPDRIGTFGMSMGGFTSLGLNSIDTRPKASVAIAPLYGENDRINSMARTQKQLHVDDWNREVPTLLLAGERDSFVLLDALSELNNKLREPKLFAILSNAGHFHWTTAGETMHELFRTSFLSGGITDPEFDAKGMAEAMRPFGELAPASHATDTARALCLAHMDAHLKSDERAKAFLEGDLAKVFAKLGIGLEVERKQHAIAC